MKSTMQHMRQAERELECRRDAAERAQKQHRDIAVQKIPALAALEEQISNTGTAVLNAIGTGAQVADYLALLEEQNIAAQAERVRLLARHGFPADYLARKHTCAQCEDTGYVRGLRCACFTALLQSLAYQELSMDTPLESSDFARFRLTHYPEAPNGDGVIPRKKMEQILAACRAYASRFHPHAGSLLFTGPTGLGKTHLSLAIAKEVIDKGFTVIYGSAPNLISRMEHEHFSRGRYGEQAGETARALLECTLLILDDLGAEFSTAFTQSCIYNIVNTRLMSAMPVLISTNLSMAQINEKYGERVASRIIGNYQVLRFFGGDVRQILRASSSFEEKGAKRP